MRRKGIIRIPGEDGRTWRGRIGREAIAFSIWRVGKRVNWCISVLELAEATRLAASTVQKICDERGWVPLTDDKKDAHVVPVDFHIRRATGEKVAQ